MGGGDATLGRYECGTGEDSVLLQRPALSLLARSVKFRVASGALVVFQIVVAIDEEYNSEQELAHLYLGVAEPCRRCGTTVTQYKLITQVLTDTIRKDPKMW